MRVEQPIAGYTGTPQIEDGFTRIANELLEAICLFDFSKRQQKVVMAIIRKTYGYNKSSDDLALSQISEITNIAKNHISETILELEAMNVISREQGKHGFHIGLNKSYDSWLPNQDSQIRTPKSGLNQSQIRTKPLPNQDFSSPKTGTTIDNPKRQLQKTIQNTVSHEKIVFDGSNFSGYEKFFWKWKEAYPAIDVLQELRKSEAWLIANPKNVKSNYARFLNNWFSRAQDKAPSARGSPQTKNQNNADKLNGAFSRIFGDKKNEPRDITDITIKLD